MNRREITSITRGEILRMKHGESADTPQRILRRPIHEDEIDRIGKEIVRRLLEAGVTEPL